MFFSILSQRSLLFLPMVHNSITYHEAIKYGSETLDNRFESEIIFCHVVNITRSYLYAHLEEVITLGLYKEYQQKIARRQRGIPVAYILSTKEFWSLELEVNEHTLIPRPETELLVQLTLAKLTTHEQAVIVDLGVGSGAVALALAKERPKWRIFGTDLSKSALQVALRNQVRHAIKNVTLLQSNWFSELPQIKFDAVISNPPYIAEHDRHLEQLAFEPQQALVSGEDGLDAIRIIIKDSYPYLNDNGWLLIEHGYDQATKVRSLMAQFGYQAIETHKDFNGIERVTVGTRRENNENSFSE